ncbi:hypothetical protein lbkm_0443 [Lachnospiraceae bacterium KM106-2]|nr:hypothetical protein lbkm_0443 [Lachnospiraceae bacterium KM106-2]
MGRYYHLSRQVTNLESAMILRDMKQLKNVKNVEITDDHAYLKVITMDDQYAEVMTSAVNICSKVARGLELSFRRFVLE